MPRANAAWWSAKLARTFVRDRETIERLCDAGWNAVIVWEHDDIELVADEIAALVRE